MGILVKCNECGEFHWNDNPCAPEYFVYHEDWLGDKPKSIRALDHKGAALKYAEYYNGVDGNLLDTTIQITVEKDGIIKYFEISAEPVVDYSAKEIENF